ncbi:MAG TPA: EpsG family protein, partial [Bacteroidota bacterium]|nr:EpsG family protein [Bacteroidota bacterium]
VFHKTALGMIPLYFVYNRSFSFKSIAMIMVLGVLTSVFLQKIITVASGFDPRYSQYGADIGTAGGYYYVAMDLAFVIFFTGIRKKILVHFEEYDRYLNMAYFGVMIDLVATLAGVDPSGILRLGFYSSIYMVLIWPIVFENLSEPLTRFVVGYLFVIGFILLFTLTLRQQSDLTPYIFNPSLHL